MSLNSLSVALSARFNATGQHENINEAIEFQREVLTLQHPAHPNRSPSLITLASFLSTRFDQTGQIVDLDEAVELLRQGLELLPELHPDRSKTIDQLAAVLLTRSEWTHEHVNPDVSTNSIGVLTKANQSLFVLGLFRVDDSATI